MSYVRFSSRDEKGRESDVYVFEHVEGYLDCCGCKLGVNSQHDTRSGMILHLQAHESVGHVVPKAAIEQLTGEIREFGDKLSYESSEEVREA